MLESRGQYWFYDALWKVLEEVSHFCALGHFGTIIWDHFVTACGPKVYNLMKSVRPRDVKCPDSALWMKHSQPECQVDRPDGWI